MTIPNIVDTGFRAALKRLAADGRVLNYAAPASMEKPKRVHGSDEEISLTAVRGVRLPRRYWRCGYQSAGLLRAWVSKEFRINLR